jgi:hypothetical protein
MVRERIERSRKRQELLRNDGKLQESYETARITEAGQTPETQV